MFLVSETVKSTTGEAARLSGYVIENSKEMHPDRVRPTVLICPGGGYSWVTDREAEPIAERMIGLGYNAFVLRYTCSPARFPVALEQAAASMALLREHSREWNIDVTKIVIAGFSAGGHVAASLATMWNKDRLRAAGFDEQQIRPNGLMLGYSVLTSGKFAHRDSFDELLGPKAKDPEALREVSLELQVDKDTPKTFIWHTMTDDLVPVENSTLFALACKNHNVPVEVHLYPKGGHGLALATPESSIPNGYGDEPGAASWMHLFELWMRRNFPMEDVLVKD
ncbi:MAG: alpha/beta hydrolase [Bifidobacteriaceae bacterium]|nr:alpha/beta hydrolase [Bifidobacteriaceae bacterium]